MSSDTAPLPKSDTLPEGPRGSIESPKALSCPKVEWPSNEMPKDYG